MKNNFVPKKSRISVKNGGEIELPQSPPQEVPAEQPLQPAQPAPGDPVQPKA